MGARQRMTMRTTIERNEVAVDDDYGQPGPPDWQIIGVNVACYVWAGGTGGKRTSSGNERTVTVDTPGAIFPLSTDIDKEDRLDSVMDRQGVELFGELYIDSVLRRKDHIAVTLRDYA